MKDIPMLRQIPMPRRAIVSAFAAGLAMTLAGCGIRGPLYMPRVPPAPTAPTVPDTGLGNPNTPMPPMPAERSETAPAGASSSGTPTLPASAPTAR
ncbi:LPS translocon maturation chaperone LptM [Cupriavidus plantarum]|uniref:LPS translocon maturation chaperone LptM n=1 Tax=Cupriavidus plantarum TaxID=942865 RepID=UPI00339D3AA3